MLNRIMLGFAIGSTLALLVEIIDIRFFDIQATKLQFYIHMALLTVLYLPVVVISFLSPKPYIDRLEILKCLWIAGAVGLFSLPFQGVHLKVSTTLVMTLSLLISGTAWNWYKHKS